VVAGAQAGLPIEFAGLENRNAEQQQAMQRDAGSIARFMEKTLRLQFNTVRSIGAIANTITGSNDAAPASAGAHLIPKILLQIGQMDWDCLTEVEILFSTS
jgi:hypothetical protein